MKSERDLQVWIKNTCKSRGVGCYKFTSPARRGVPDLLLVHGRVVFVEVKTPTGRGRLSTLQKREIERLRNLGAEVHVVDSVSKAEQIIEALLAAG